MTDYNTRVDVAHLTGQVIDLSTVGDGSISPARRSYDAAPPAMGEQNQILLPSLSKKLPT